ncbi:MAG: tripartite tricarboxylate transporter TctB family protein [Thermodesulfobacteriota bacterium]
MSTEKIKRAIPYVAIFLASAYFYSLANRFQFMARPGHLGPDFWPKLLLGLTMAACLYEVIKTFFFLKADTVPQPTTKETADERMTAKRSYPGLLTIGILMTLAYVYLVRFLGFTLCTMLYFALFMLVGRYRKPWAILANSMVGTLILVFIFMKIVYVSLPLGYGPFSTFSLLVTRMMGVK